MGTATNALPTTSHLVHSDQRWIAYQTNRDGSEAVWLIHPDGTGDHRIAQGVNDEQVIPDWSPDGKRLVFATRRGDHEPSYELWPSSTATYPPTAAFGSAKTWPA